MRRHPGPVVTVCVLVALAGTACRKRSEPEPMVRVEAARLMMGCDPTQDPSCSETERPQVPREVAAFRIDRHEVTQRRYAECIEARSCVPPPRDFVPRRTPDHPVVQVTWAEARAYCHWRGKRLPTEEEWELAARGTDGRKFPWGDAEPTCAHAHLNACGSGAREVGTRPVGASPSGALDMAGNVDEWVEDVYAPHDAPQRSSGQRTARGGAYDAWHSRTTARSGLHPAYRDALLGFRCAAEADAR